MNPNDLNKLLSMDHSSTAEAIRILNDEIAELRGIIINNKDAFETFVKELPGALRGEIKVTRA